MKKFLAICAVALVPIIATHAADKAAEHKHDMQMGMAPQSGLPTEAGQSAFAAIQEIVAKLEADPATDWSKVDIEALRQHLIDMSNVTLAAKVQVEESNQSITFIVAGEGAVRDSIRRMVKAHAETMNGTDHWSFAESEVDNGASLTVTPPKAISMQEVRALGFIGIMASGMHHQMHHWMIATGSNPHQ